MPGKTKVISIREEELDENKHKTGWVKLAKAIAPDCKVSEALNKTKKIGAYEILPDTINWETPDGMIISNEERHKSGGAIVNKSKKETEAYNNMSEIMKELLIHMKAKK